jgi:hypothetical protein
MYIEESMLDQEWRLVRTRTAEVRDGHRLLFGVRRKEGRAIAQAVSRRLPTAAARVQTRIWSCGIL